MGVSSTAVKENASIVETTSMSENGRLVLPAAVRKAADIRPKEILTVRVDDAGVHIQTRRQAIKRAQEVVQSLTKGRTGLVEEFLRERREEAARE